MAAKLTPDLAREIERRAAAGETTSAITEWVQSQGVDISYQAIRKRLNVGREERAAITKAVVREKLGKTVLSDLDRLERIRKVLHRKAQRWHDAADPDNAEGLDKGVAATKVWTGIVAQEHRCIVDKLHYAGADAPERMSDAEVERRWQELKRAIAEAGE